MKLTTKAIDAKLRRNHEYRVANPEAYCGEPVVRLFDAWGSAVWLIHDYDDERDVFFGLAYLGDPDMAEMGYISRAELEALGIRIERDLYFRPEKGKNLMAYWEEVRGTGKRP